MNEELAAAVPESRGAERVLVSVSRVDGDLLGDIRDACAKAHARYVPWTGEVGAGAGLKGAPLVVMTALRVGERKLPDDVVDFVTNECPGVSVLVLSKERLLRPTMSLQNGRVTLVGPPLSSPRIASALRGVLGERSLGYTSTDTARGLAGPPPVNVRRTRRGNHWVAVLSRAGAQGGNARPPPVRHTRTEGLSILLPRPGTSAEPSSNAVAACLRRETDALRAAALDSTFGDACGVLHLDAAAEEWVVHWPDPNWPLLLSSPLRLPNLWDMAGTLRKLKSRFHRLKAAPCDMFAAMTSAHPLPTSTQTSTQGSSLDELALALGEGGSAFTELLEGRLRDHAVEFYGAVVEVY